jgi:ADP-ribosylation factor GTPase-activating protein 2/3
VHRSLGVHVSFVRSTTLDAWTEEQLRIMAVGGNGRARTFFKQHGWTETGSDKIESKYTSRAAALYRQTLAKEAAKYVTGGVATGGSPQLASSGSLDPMKMLDSSGKLSPQAFPRDPAGIAQPQSPLAAAQPEHAELATEPYKSAATGTFVSATSRKSKIVLGGRKATASKGKKPAMKRVDAEVDDSLFSQVCRRVSSDALWHGTFQSIRVDAGCCMPSAVLPA